MKGRPWTQKEEDLLQDMAASGVSNDVAASLLDRTISAIYTRRRRAGWYGPGYSPNDINPASAPRRDDEVPDEVVGYEAHPGEVPGYWTTVWSRSFLFGLITITKQRRTT